jgi:citrate lyase subunit beta / citryl-CoA lyase
MRRGLCMNVWRSYLFVPATKSSYIQKAVDSEVDCIILDLEDSVVPSEKQSARESVKETLGKYKERKPFFIRINDITTPHWMGDLTYAFHYGATGVIVPKVEGIEGIRQVCHQIRKWMKLNNQDFEVIPLIESAKGIRYMYEIAAEDNLITRLAFGSIDFSLDIDCELTPGGLELLYARSQMVISSKAAGIGAPIDAVYPDLSNTNGLIYEATFAKQIGFKSKMIIHPKQIPFVHQVFSPSANDVEQARKIVEAFENAEKQGSASIQVGNKLVDYPVYKKAKKLLTLI